MPTIYDNAPADAVTLLDRILRSYHAELIECGAEIGLTFASNAKGPAVKRGGYPRAAQVKVCSQKDRLRKKIDAEITVDVAVWNELSDAQRAALIDHEAEHLRRIEWSAKKYAKLVEEDGNAVRWKLDSLGRPQLKTVNADVDVGDAFACIIERHGDAACEFRNARVFQEFAQKALAARESAEK